MSPSHLTFHGHSRIIAPVFTTDLPHPCSNKIQNGGILVLAYQGRPGKRPLNVLLSPLIKASDVSNEVRLLLPHGSNFGWMSFLLPPHDSYGYQRELKPCLLGTSHNRRPCLLCLNNIMTMNENIPQKGWSIYRSKTEALTRLQTLLATQTTTRLYQQNNSNVSVVGIHPNCFCHNFIICQTVYSQVQLLQLHVCSLK